MKNRFLPLAALAIGTLLLSGCVSENAQSETGAYIDTSSKTGACEMIVTDLAAYSAKSMSESDGLSDYLPETMLAFQEGAIAELDSISKKIDHSGVRDALDKVRDASAEMIPLLERIVENPDIATDGSIEAEVTTANEHAEAALTELGVLCPDVVGASSGTIR